MFGELEEIYGWSVTSPSSSGRPGRGFEGGILIEPDRCHRGREPVPTVRGLARLRWCEPGLTVPTSRSDGDADGHRGRLHGAAGSAPEELQSSAAEPSQLSWTVTDDLVVIGYGQTS